MDEDKDKQVKPEEVKPEETKAEETKAEETKAEETKAEDTKAEEVKPYEVEREWAETLGMEFDVKQVEEGQQALNQPSAQTPPPTPGQPVQGFAPAQPQSGAVYGMNPNQPLPPYEQRPPMPKTYMVWAIISTICCCLISGIVAIFFAANVSTKYYQRDFAGAEKASEQAQIWIIVSIVLGVVTNTVYLPLSMMG